VLVDGVDLDVQARQVREHEAAIDLVVEGIPASRPGGKTLFANVCSASPADRVATWVWTVDKLRLRVHAGGDEAASGGLVQATR
jgi:hypothetical protein